MAGYFLKLQGGQSSVQPVLSQADINSAHEGQVEFFMMEKDQVYKLRTVLAPGVDPRADKTPVIDAWIPVQGIPEETVEALRKANDEDAKAQGANADSLRRARAEGRGEIPVASQRSLETRDMRDPNWRNSVEAKELADRIKAGNLVKDVPPGSLPHDGVPGAHSTANSDQPGVANHPQNAQVKENVDRATGKVPNPETSEAAKPGAPSPGFVPPQPKGAGK